MKKFARKCAAFILAGVMMVMAVPAMTNASDDGGWFTHGINGVFANDFHHIPSHLVDTLAVRVLPRDTNFAGMGLFSERQMDMVGLMQEAEQEVHWLTFDTFVRFDVLDITGIHVVAQTQEHQESIEFNLNRFEPEYEPGFYLPPSHVLLTHPGIYIVRISNIIHSDYIIEIVGGETTQTPPTSQTQTQNNEINVTIGSTPINFADQPPTLVDGRTLVPVRGVFEALGFEVDWEGATSTAVITNANYEIRITIGSNIFTTNGIEHTLDVPAQSIGGRTMVPIRLPLESVGVEVDWDGATSTVVITTPPPSISLENWDDLGMPSDPSMEELRTQIASRGMRYDLSVNGRPAFRVTASERASILEFIGNGATQRFDFFGTLGYMREIDGETIFLIFSVIE